ncbi:MAG: CDP-archaeol synthase [Nanoarchaeota archaeon]
MIWTHVLFIGLAGGFANMMPVLVQHVNLLAYPVDGGKKWRGKRILGENKTWRGLLSGILGGVIGMLVISFFLSLIGSAQLSLPAVIIGGALIGIGTMLGDMLFSLVKRQVGIAPGKPFIPFDQLDWILGAWTCLGVVIGWSWQALLVLVMIFGPLHIAVNYAGYIFGLRKTKI